MKRLWDSAKRTIWPQVAAIVVLYGIGLVTIGGFGTWRSILAMLVLACFVGIAAAGQTMVALLGGIDLSIPGVIALANIATAQLTGSGWPFWQVALLLVVLALLIGAFNGFVSNVLRINPLIVTLGVGSVITGAILVWTGGQPTGRAPGWLNAFVAPSATTFGLPVPPILILWAMFAVVVLVTLRRTAFGKRVYATGASQPAARFALVSNTRIWTLTFALSALAAAIAGVLLAGFTTQGDVRIAAPYLFSTIASVVIGGTSLVGARGGYGRTILGAIILTEITTLLVANNMSAAAQQTMLGIIILVVVASYGREPSVSQRL